MARKGDEEVSRDLAFGYISGLRIAHKLIKEQLDIFERMAGIAPHTAEEKEDEAPKRQVHSEETRQILADRMKEQWVAKRATKKAKKGKKAKPQPVYTDDLKRKVVAAVRKGMTYGEAAKKFRITWFSARNWTESGKFEPSEQTGD